MVATAAVESRMALLVTNRAQLSDPVGSGLTARLFSGPRLSVTVRQERYHEQPFLSFTGS